MKPIFAALALACSVGFPFAAVAHRIPQINRIGDAVTGVSADGSAVAAFAFIGNDLQIVRWTEASGPMPLGVGVAFDISRDGSTLVGSRFNGTTTRAVRWTATTGIVELGQLPGAGSASFNEAYDVSSDGSVIIGFADTNSTFGIPMVGFRWTAATGMVALNDLPGGDVLAQASAISANGTVIVGYGTGPDSARAVRWINNSTSPLNMGLPPGRVGFTEARHVSGDGQVVVGVWGNGLENEAFRWTASTGYELLGDLPGGLLDSIATATNHDGSVIVGTGNPGEDLPDQPFYWTRDRGLRPFVDVLTDAGIDYSEWERFVELRDLSDDGLVVGGTGVLRDGTFAGFRAVIPEPSSTAPLLLGLLLAARRRK